MKKKNDPAFSTDDIQVFELTMDNTEDQEELNRLFRKPGEPPYRPLPKNGRASASDRIEATGKKGRNKKP